MTAKTVAFETIVFRNNTLPAEQNTRADPHQNDTKTAMTTNLRGNAPHGKNAILIAAFSVVLCFCLLSTAGAASIQKKREIASTTESTPSPTKICQENTPCGWAIYIPFTRRIDYLMRNTCDCHSSLACMKTDDDLSMNAYVYRCKSRPSSTVVTTDVMPTNV